MCCFSYIVYRTLIWLRRCYLLIKTQSSILKWYGSTIFVEQFSSSSNRLVTTPNSSSTIDKSTPINLDILKDCEKTFSTNLDKDFCYKTLRIP